MIEEVSTLKSQLEGERVNSKNKLEQMKGEIKALQSQLKEAHDIIAKVLQLSYIYQPSTFHIYLMPSPLVTPRTLLPTVTAYQ